MPSVAVKQSSTREFLNELYIVISAYTIFVMVGINRSYSTFLIPELRLPTSVIRISDEQQYWIENLNNFITPTGCLIGGIIADVFGRKMLLISTLVPCIFGWLTIAVLNNIVTLYFGIILNALSSGMAFCVVVYISEICSFDTRSIFLNLKEPAFAIGVIGNSLTIKRNGWRLSAYYCLALSIVSLILQCFLPESPSWLIINDVRDNGRNSDKASRILSSVRYSKAEVEKEIQNVEIRYNTTNNKDNDNNRHSGKKINRNFLHFFRFKDMSECRKQFAIMFGMIALQQLSGVNVLTGCTVLFYDGLRIPFTNRTTFIHTATGFVTSFIPFLTSLYLGRKDSLIISGLGTCLATGTMAIYETNYRRHDNNNNNNSCYYYYYYEPYFWMVTIGVYVYYFFASIAIIIQATVVPSELFPTPISGLACGICGSVLYVGAFLTRYLFAYFYSTINCISLASTLWFMALCALINVPFAKYVLPETHEKTLNQIQAEYFRKRH